MYLIFIVPAALVSPIAPDKTLTGHVISSLNKTYAMECFKVCLGTSLCKSFNYNGQLKKCEVSGSNAEIHEMTDQEGFCYYEPTSHEIISV